MSPKPQTRFKPVLLVCTLLIVIFFESCSDKVKSNLAAFKDLDENLVNSNKNISYATISYLKNLENKMTDRATVERAKVWLPRANRVAGFSDTVVAYIENLKLALKQEAGGESFRESDKNAVMRLFEKRGKGAELYENMKKYKSDLLSIDSQMAQVFNEFPVIISTLFDTTQDKQKEFTKSYFDDIPAIAGLAMLTRFESNIKIAENEVIEYSNNHVGKIGDWFETYSAIISQSSNIVNANDNIEITAGVGAFSKAALPQIVINGKEIEINATGAAIYSFKANSKAGKYTIPVKILFKDETGRDQTITRNVEYTVVETKL